MGRSVSFAILVLGLWLAACGGDDDATASNGSGATGPGTGGIGGVHAGGGGSGGLLDDTDADADAGSAADSDAHADADADSDADSDADTDTEVDHGEKIGKGGWLCDGRALVFEDEFDSMDWNAWSMKCTNAMVRDAECKQENVSAQNGELHIRTKRIGTSNKYTSAGIASRDAWLTAGRTVCIDAKLPGARGAGNGLWPALWFMPTRGECWPYGGEIDLLEMVNADGEVHNVYHYVAGHTNGVTTPMCGNLDRKREIHVTTQTSPAWYQQHHEYALKMTEDTIIYYLDGKETLRVRKGDQQAFIDTATTWGIQINTAVGGSWPKPVDSSTVNDTYFRVRSVKVVDSSVDHSNVALGKTAHQSSTAMGGVASRAVDGNASGDWGKSSTTHTNSEAGAWWMVDLGREFDIARVSTFNRTDCCGFRLSNYRVEYLDGNQHFIDSINYPGEQGNVAHHVRNVPGVRYVRVKLNGTGVLSLAEVKVYTDNVALGKTATQSSTAMGGVASRAVDGNANGAWGQNSTTHTNSEAGAWWMVDLKRLYDVAKVSTYNRTDCCGFRLSNYKVEYLDASQKVIDSIDYPGEQGEVAHHVHNVPGVRYVRVKLNGTGVLSLAEVMVFK